MASILRAFSRTKLVSVDSNDDRLKAILEGNYSDFRETLQNQFNWGSRPLFDWDNITHTVQEAADEAMQLYQQWQWLTRYTKDVYKWNPDYLVSCLDTTDYQVIAKIMLTSYDFGITQRLSAIAPAFEQSIQQADMLLSSSDDDDVDAGYDLFYRQVDVYFRQLMLSPQLYASSLRTTELPVLMTLAGVSVIETSDVVRQQQSLPVQQPISHAVGRPEATQRKRRRVGQFDEVEME